MTHRDAEQRILELEGDVERMTSEVAALEDDLRLEEAESARWKERCERARQWAIVWGGHSSGCSWFTIPGDDPRIGEDSEHDDPSTCDCGFLAAIADEPPSGDPGVTLD